MVMTTLIVMTELIMKQFVLMIITIILTVITTFKTENKTPTTIVMEY